MRWEMSDWLGAGDSLSRDDEVLGVCGIQWMQYLVLTQDAGMEWLRRMT